MVAFSSKRVGKKDVEADAYLSLGIIHDNQNKLKQAIENYKAYLTMCEEKGDVDGQAFANNCIGVNYIYLCCKNQQGILHTISREDPATSSNIQLAMEYHEKHLRIADVGGQFIALTNLGLCYGVLRNIVQSAKCHQDALRAAIKMQSIYGQSIAVGNLGMLAVLKSDFKTARTCYEQHLNLVQALQDKEAEVNAWKMLAELSTIEGSLDATESLQEARRVAAKEGYTSELRRLHCLLGRAVGLTDFYDYAHSIASENIAPEDLAF
jgi:tetratricopeptide (TPR) repeat protein